MDEIGRCDVAVREAYTEGADSMIQAIARHLDDGDPQRTNDRAVGLFSLLAGSLQAARAVTDPELSDRILAAAYSNAMTLAPLRTSPHARLDRKHNEGPRRR